MCKCLSVRHQWCFSHLCQQPRHVALSYIFGTPGRGHSPVVAYEQTPHYSHCNSRPSCSDWSNARRRWHYWHCRERGDLGLLPLFQPRSPASEDCSLWQSCREVRGFLFSHGPRLHRGLFLGGGRLHRPLLRLRRCCAIYKHLSRPRSMRNASRGQAVLNGATRGGEGSRGNAANAETSPVSVVGSCA